MAANSFAFCILNAFSFAFFISSVFSLSVINPAFNNVSFIAWNIDLKAILSSANLTSNFAGWTFTSTFDGGISISKTKNANFPIGSIPLNACSTADDNVLSFIYLLFTKNIWLDLFDLAIVGFPITPFIFIYSYS